MKRGKCGKSEKTGKGDREGWQTGDGKQNCLTASQRNYIVPIFPFFPLNLMVETSVFESRTIRQTNFRKQLIF